MFHSVTMPCGVMAFLVEFTMDMNSSNTWWRYDAFIEAIATDTCTPTLHVCAKNDPLSTTRKWSLARAGTDALTARLTNGWPEGQ